MKLYTVTQKGGYRVFETFNKEEAKKCLEEHNKRCKDNFYICEQGKEEK